MLGHWYFIIIQLTVTRPFLSIPTLYTRVHREGLPERPITVACFESFCALANFQRLRERSDAPMPAVRPAGGVRYRRTDHLPACPKFPDLATRVRRSSTIADVSRSASQPRFADANLPLSKYHPRL